MKKGKKAILVCGAIVLLAIGAMGGHVLQTEAKSKEHNLITVDTSAVPSPVTKAPTEKDIQLDEIKMHYAVYGEQGKKPLILIHGNGGSCKNLSDAAKYFANDYTVYVIESRCHGKSTDTEKITYKLMAKDTAQFIKKLKLDKPYIVGHSDGAIVALTLGATEPNLPGAIVSCGANSVPETFKFYFTHYVMFSDMVEKSKLNELMLTLPDFTKEDFAKIKCPTYVVAGEFDIMKLSDTVYIHESIENSKIAIIKGADHGSYISRNGKQIYAISKEYFESL